MFGIGKWKSVEFEWPTVGFYSFDGVLNVSSLQSLIDICKEHDINAVGVVDMMNVRNQQFEFELVIDKNYLYNLKMNPDIYTTRQSRVLGISELYGLKADCDVLLVQESKFHTEIRKDLSVIELPAVNNKHDLMTWPLGNFNHLKSDWTNCDIKVGRGVLKNDESKDQLLDYSQEGIDIISDRDTFERSFIEVLKEVIRKKQSVD